MKGKQKLVHKDEEEEKDELLSLHNQVTFSEPNCASDVQVGLLEVKPTEYDTPDSSAAINDSIRGMSDE